MVLSVPVWTVTCRGPPKGPVGRVIAGHGGLPPGRLGGKDWPGGRFFAAGRFFIKNEG